jgi:hypothetical protein
LHTGNGLAHYETELRVQGEGTIVVRRLNQADARELLFGRPHHDGSHELAADVFVLYRWVNRNRSNPGNLASLIQAIASDHPSALFGDNAEKRRVRKHHRKDSNWDLRTRKIRRKIVVSG